MKVKDLIKSLSSLDGEKEIGVLSISDDGLELLTNKIACITSKIGNCEPLVLTEHVAKHIASHMKH